MENSHALTVPLTGTGRLSLVDGKRLTSQLGMICAAWQNITAKTPVRVVIRVDGQANKSRGDAVEFPCAVLRVDYTQGGLARTVKIDCADQQSALVVWADSVECIPEWDDRRIERIAATYKPKPENIITAAISAGEQGDFGAADARWLDAIHVDATTETHEVSIHPIPFGARGVRFLNTLVSGANFSVPNAALFIAWSAEPWLFPDSTVAFPKGLVQVNIHGETDTSILIAPPVAKYLFLIFTKGTIASFDVPSFLEWDYSPDTLPGF